MLYLSECLTYNLTDDTVYYSLWDSCWWKSDDDISQIAVNTYYRTLLLNDII